MAHFPLSPRLARFLLEAESRGDSDFLKEAARLAALLSEEKAGSEDLLEELKKYQPGFEAKRLEGQLTGLLKPTASHLKESGKNKPFNSHSTLAQCLLTAFPDRVAKVRVSGGSESRNKSGRIRELVLCGGGTVLAQDNSLTREQDYFIVVDAQETPQGVKARSLCPIELDWLLDLVSEGLSEEKSCEWNSKAQRVEGFKRLKYGQLVLDEKPLAAQDLGPETGAILYKEALNAGPQAYCDPEELEGFLGRVKFTASLSPGFPHFSSSTGISLDDFVEKTLLALSKRCRSFADLKSAGLVGALRAQFTAADQSLLERLAPASVALPGGRRSPLRYEAGKPPWTQSRIQDFFGLPEGPKVGGGKVPVVLHLLSPGKKPVQITADLAGFWKNHYPQIRKEFLRRYPRHQWPENPL
jgi:ATP-dependent helicase HrpB